MSQLGKSKIRQVLEEKKQKSETLLKEMQPEETGSETITIANLYSQLQSLKHEIDIETIQNKLKKYDPFFKFLDEHEEILTEMIAWYQQKKREGSN